MTGYELDPAEYISEGDERRAAAAPGRVDGAVVGVGTPAAAATCARSSIRAIKAAASKPQTNVTPQTAFPPKC